MRKRKQYNCYYCGNIFLKEKYRKSKYCNQTCYHLSKIGKPSPTLGLKHSEKTKKRISNKLKRRHTSPNTEFKKGHKINLGKKNSLGVIRSEETRRKIGIANKGKTKGEKNGNWNGGSSFKPYGKEFNKELKEKIRQRDNYRCQECFRHQNELFDKNGRKYSLIVHHIDYNKRNNDPKNLISLCANCHMKTNYNREDWINYFNERKIKKTC